MFLFPRPPLSIIVPAFVIIHLLGDPIDTIQNLIFKLSTCESLFRYWQHDHQHEHMKVRRLALVADAYGEWSEDGTIKDFLVRVHHDNLDREHDSTNLEETIERTANSLAADRSTTILPVIFAMVFYVATVATAVGRTISATNAESNTVFIHVEAHSLEFSAQFFWILPAVFLGSVIGVSQTENAIPHILSHFRKDLNPSLLPTELGPPEITIVALYF